MEDTRRVQNELGILSMGQDTTRVISRVWVRENDQDRRCRELSNQTCANNRLTGTCYRLCHALRRDFYCVCSPSTLSEVVRKLSSFLSLAYTSGPHHKYCGLGGFVDAQHYDGLV